MQQLRAEKVSVWGVLWVGLVWAWYVMLSLSLQSCLPQTSCLPGTVASMGITSACLIELPGAQASAVKHPREGHGGSS